MLFKWFEYWDDYDLISCVDIKCFGFKSGSKLVLSLSLISWFTMLQRCRLSICDFEISSVLYQECEFLDSVLWNALIDCLWWSNFSLRFSDHFYNDLNCCAMVLGHDQVGECKNMIMIIIPKACYLFQIRIEKSQCKKVYLILICEGLNESMKIGFNILYTIR